MRKTQGAQHNTYSARYEKTHDALIQKCFYLLQLNSDTWCYAHHCRLFSARPPTQFVACNSAEVVSQCTSVRLRRLTHNASNLARNVATFVRTFSLNECLGYLWQRRDILDTFPHNPVQDLVQSLPVNIQQEAQKMQQTVTSSLTPSGTGVMR